MKFLEKMKFDEKGLIPAIIQDADTNEVLMLAYMNEDSFLETMETGLTHFWSRSRKKLWKKGESSGHTQKVHEILFDCDIDTLLIKVHQTGAACHKGYRSCFYRKIVDKKGKVRTKGKKVFDPEKVYKKK
ncbi:MAG: phosphoribosyl-AMP cyclohydrolase [Candidatus Tritonobacter lacicola]|nr:phosphoribosyl-AMP cyclohydrolase [Candidatus Tritonobacter lacicola]